MQVIFRLINRRSQYRLFRQTLRALLILACLGLAGCASVQTSKNTAAEQDIGSVAELNPDQAEVPTDAELASDPDLPKMDLDATTLEKLLLSNLASFSGEWGIAGENAAEVAKTSKDYRLARLATLLALRNDDYVAAAENAGLWAELKPSSVNAQNMRLLSLVGSGQTDAAIKAINEYQGELAIDDYVKQLASLLVRQKNEVAAFAVASHLVEENPDSAQVLLSSAYVAETFRLFEAAESWVATALQMRPSWDLAAQMKANLLRSQNKTEERAAFISEFVEANPSSVTMRINHAGELAREKKYQQAFDLMSAVLKDSPNNAGGLQYAAALAETLEEGAQATKLYRKALREDPTNDEVRWSLGRLAATANEYAKAERYFNDITSEELVFRARIQVANMRYETKGVDAAVNSLWTLEPRTSEEWMEVVLTRHYLLMRAQRFDEAMGYINEAIVYVPENLELLYSRALVAAELKDVAMAERDLREIIAQNPEHANALNALGYTLADQTDRYEEARTLIEKALALRPQDAHILDSMGWVSYRLNDLDTAVEYLQKAYDVSPEIEIAAHLGEVLWEAGSKQEANLVWKKSYEEDADNPVLNETLKRYGVVFPEL